MGKIVIVSKGVMMNHCVVVGCSDYVGKKLVLRFLSFPTYRIVEKRARWIEVVRRSAREKWTLGNCARICNEHFVLGKSRMIIIRLFVVCFRQHISVVQRIRSAAILLDCRKERRRKPNGYLNFRRDWNLLMLNTITSE